MPARGGFTVRSTGTGKNFKLFDFKNVNKKPLSVHQKRIQSISLSRYSRRYMWHLITGGLLAILGCLMCVISLYCVQIVLRDTAAAICLHFHHLKQYRNRLGWPGWYTLVALYYMRYPGPVFAGFGIFLMIIVTLFIFWLIDRDVSREGYSSNRMDIYDIQARNWLAQQKEASKEEAVRQLLLPDSLLAESSCHRVNSWPVKKARTRKPTGRKFASNFVSNIVNSKSYNSVPVPSPNRPPIEETVKHHLALPECFHKKASIISGASSSSCYRTPNRSSIASLQSFYTAATNNSLCLSLFDESESSL